jgi:hypothetical protein
MMFLKAVSAARLEGVITTDLSLYLSAHDTDSYPGSGSTWTDLSTNANNATLYNSPTFSTDNGGILDFDGVNDYGDDGSTTGTPFGFGSGAFTVEYWVKYDNMTAYHTVLDSRRRSSFYNSNFGYSDFIEPSNDTFNVYRNTATIFTSNAALSANTWYHLVLSRSSTATNDTRFYVNNVLDKTTTINVSFTDYGVYYIGRNIEGSAYSNGKLAQLRVYKGKGLTAAEVTRNWNAHRRLYGL